jgi:hypothetical protein
LRSLFVTAFFFKRCHRATQEDFPKSGEILGKARAPAAHNPGIISENQHRVLAADHSFSKRHRPAQAQFHDIGREILIDNKEVIKIMEVVSDVKIIVSGKMIIG